MKCDPKEKLQLKDDSITQLLEKLAELEHDQWIHYSKNLSKRIQQSSSIDDLRNKTVTRWKRKWRPYEDLSDKEKEKDRIWAYKVLELLKSDKNAIDELFDSSRDVRR